MAAAVLALSRIVICDTLPSKTNEALPRTDEACCGCGSDRRFMTSFGKNQAQIGPMNGLSAYKRHNRTIGAGGMIAQSVADILGDHVNLSVEGIVLQQR